MHAWQTSLHAVALPHSAEQLARDITESTPFEAITGVTPLIDSIASTQDVSLGERIQMVFSIDEAAQMHARSYIERFLALSGEAQSERRSLWTLARGYWATVLDAYGELLSAVLSDPEVLADRALVAQIAVRTIRAGVLRSKWDAFGGAAMDHAGWACVNAAYALAIRAGADRMPVRPRADRTTETFAEREYLRAVALLSLGLNQLDPLRVEAATSLVHYILPMLELSDTPSSTACYWVDVSLAMPPMRLLTVPSQLALPRYFSGAAAVMSLTSLLDLCAAGELPPGLPLQREGASRVLASVLSRMVKVWTNEVPIRRHRRLPMASQMHVAEGLPKFVGKLLGELENPVVWQVSDASVQGLGVRVPASAVAKLRVGSLIGFRPVDGDCWCVGAVRRIKRPSWCEVSAHDQALVGIEKLGSAPEAVIVDDGAQSQAALLLDPLQKGIPVRLVVPVPGPLAGQVLYLLGGAKPVKLVPLETIEHGTDYVIRSYIHAA